MTRISKAPLRAVIYPRISLDAEGKGESVARQEKACRSLCDARGWQVVAVHRDTMSGYDETKKRPGWSKVLAMVEAEQVDVIVAWHIDRVTRSMRALEDLIVMVEERGVGIATATGDIDLTTDTGRMVARILAAVARAEVERKAARQKLANSARAAAGLPWTGGTRPFGYAQDGMTLIEAEAEGYRWAARAVLSGAHMGTVAAGLAERGLHSTRQGGRAAPFNRSGLRKMLMNPRYAGIRMHHGTEMGPGTWPAIVDQETHRQLVQLLGSPERDLRGLRPGRRTPTKPELLCSLIARCGRCGNQFIVGGGTKHGTARYKCRSDRGCLSVAQAVLDEEVSAAVLGLLRQPDFVASLIPADDATAATLRTQIDRLTRRLRVVNDDYADGQYDEDETEYKRLTRELRARIKTSRQALDELGTTTALTGLSLGSDAVLAEWGELEVDRRRAIIAELLDIEVDGCGPGNRWDADKHLRVRRRGGLRAA